MAFRIGRVRNLVGLVFGLILLSGCGGDGPQPIDPSGTEWLSYNDPRNGFLIKYPATYKVTPSQGGEVGFTGPDDVLNYRVVFADNDSGKKRGLWVSSDPVGSLTISSHTAQRYVYDHWDGPVYSKTAAYVFQVSESRMMGVEFRLDKNNKDGTLDPGQQIVLDSLVVL